MSLSIPERVINTLLDQQIDLADLRSFVEEQGEENKPFSEEAKTEIDTEASGKEHFDALLSHFVTDEKARADLFNALRLEKDHETSIKTLQALTLLTHPNLAKIVEQAVDFPEETASILKALPLQGSKDPKETKLDLYTQPQLAGLIENDNDILARYLGFAGPYRSAELKTQTEVAFPQIRTVPSPGGITVEQIQKLKPPKNPDIALPTPVETVEEFRDRYQLAALPAAWLNQIKLNMQLYKNWIAPPHGNVDISSFKTFLASLKKAPFTTLPPLDRGLLLKLYLSFKKEIQIQFDSPFSFCQMMNGVRSTDMIATLTNAIGQHNLSRASLEEVEKMVAGAPDAFLRNTKFAISIRNQRGYTPKLPKTRSNNMEEFIIQHSLEKTGLQASTFDTIGITVDLLAETRDVYQLEQLTGAFKSGLSFNTYLGLLIAIRHEKMVRSKEPKTESKSSPVNSLQELQEKYNLDKAMLKTLESAAYDLKTLRRMRLTDWKNEPAISHGFTLGRIMSYALAIDKENALLSSMGTVEKAKEDENETELKSSSFPEIKGVKKEQEELLKTYQDFFSRHELSISNMTSTIQTLLNLDLSLRELWCLVSRSKADLGTIFTIMKEGEKLALYLALRVDRENAESIPMLLVLHSLHDPQLSTILRMDLLARYLGLAGKWDHKALQVASDKAYKSTVAAPGGLAVQESKEVEPTRCVRSIEEFYLRYPKLKDLLNEQWIMEFKYAFRSNSEDWVTKLRHEVTPSLQSLKRFLACSEEFPFNTPPLTRKNAIHLFIALNQELTIGKKVRLEYHRRVMAQQTVLASSSSIATKSAPNPGPVTSVAAGPIVSAAPNPGPVTSVAAGPIPSAAPAPGPVAVGPVLPAAPLVTAGPKPASTSRPAPSGPFAPGLVTSMPTPSAPPASVVTTMPAPPAPGPVTSIATSSAPPAPVTSIPIPSAPPAPAPVTSIPIPSAPPAPAPVTSIPIPSAPPAPGQAARISQGLVSMSSVTQQILGNLSGSSSSSSGTTGKLSETASLRLFTMTAPAHVTAFSMTPKNLLMLYVINSKTAELRELSKIFLEEVERLESDARDPSYSPKVRENLTQKSLDICQAIHQLVLGIVSEDEPILTKAILSAFNDKTSSLYKALQNPTSEGLKSKLSFWAPKSYTHIKTKLDAFRDNHPEIKKLTC